MTARSRGVLSGLGLSMGSLVFGLFAAEGALRALHYVPARYPSTGRLHDAAWTMLLDCYPTNPRGYFDIDLREPAMRERYHRLAPQRYEAISRRAPWAVEFRYNALRFRDGELGPKGTGVRRIMVLGDSFTEGQGVKEPDTYPRLLEKALNSAEPGRWEVRNCGRRGADFPELYEAFVEVLKYDPDVVVYGMVLNDAEQSGSFHARQAYVNDWILDRGRLLEGRPMPESGLFDLRLAGFVLDRIESYRIGRASTRWYLDMYGEPNRGGWERTQGHLREMDRRMRERGRRLLVAVWPLLVNLEGGYPFVPVHETIGRFCGAAGIPRTDLLDVFSGRRTADLWVHPVDMHPNETAHRIAAESLAPIVRGLVGEMER